MAEIIESNSVELEPVSDRAVLGVADPEQALAAAARFAKALKVRIDAGGLAHRINGQDYLGIEALQMAATALGIVGVIVETRQLEDGSWEARAEARTLSGQVVGAGESMCGADEPRWARRAGFERRGMAQTRALSRALRGPVGSVVSLAAYSVTSAEEMDAQAAEAEPMQLPGWARPADVQDAARALVSILEALDVPEPAKVAAKIGQRIFDRCDSTVPVCVDVALVAIADIVGGETEAGS